MRIIDREVLIEDLLLSTMLSWMDRVHQAELVLSVLLALPEVAHFRIFKGLLKLFCRLLSLLRGHAKIRPT